MRLFIYDVHPVALPSSVNQSAQFWHISTTFCAEHIYFPYFYQLYNTKMSDTTWRTT